MKKEDFKEIKKEHFKVCKEMIRKKGECYSIRCNTCPFNTNNNSSETSCNFLYAEGSKSTEEDLKLVKSAKEFLKFKKELIEFDLFEEKPKQNKKYKVIPMIIENYVAVYIFTKDKKGIVDIRVGGNMLNVKKANKILKQFGFKIND